MLRTALLSLLLAAAVHAETFPIVDVEHGFLIGAAGGGKWVKMEDAAKAIRGGEQYRLYTLTEQLGAMVKGGKPKSADEPCPDQQVIALTPKPKSGTIAIAGSWNALPRIPKLQDTTQPVYQKAIADFLTSKGIHDPKVKIIRIVRVDLDGDGEDEVLISATNYFSKDGVPTGARQGSYSCVVLRRVIGGKVDTQLIDGEFYPKATTFSAPNWYEISAVLDLDGDGKMEVILESGYYEGGATAVYSVTGKKPKQLLIVGCGA